MGSNGVVLIAILFAHFRPQLAVAAAIADWPILINLFRAALQRTQQVAQFLGAANFALLCTSAS